MDNAQYEASKQLANLNADKLDFVTSRYDINAALANVLIDLVVETRVVEHRLQQAQPCRGVFHPWHASPHATR